MSDTEKNFEKWKKALGQDYAATFDQMNAADREDAFYRDLAFGTGGLRGKLGLGPNRMNEFTVGRATQGLANYLLSKDPNPTVALCRDTRHGSEEFVHCVAEVLAANDIVTYLFERVEPTPALSFAVRELGCSAGVNITASHNPAAYNGYKVYGSDGCQITVEAAAAIQHAINDVDVFEGVRRIEYSEAVERGVARRIPERVLDRYIESTLSISTGQDCSKLHVVYTPLHGVGFECVSRVLEKIGIGSFEVVADQAVKDGDFPTCPYPNPEIREALELGLSLCEQVKPDLLLATDPDADRVGIAVRHDGTYRLLTGNEVGLLLLDYLAMRAVSGTADPDSFVAVTTVVSAPMADDISKAYGIELRRTLTGFKFIGEQVGILESQHRQDDFLFAFEESYGYLAGTAVRDKDAVVASMLICELAAYWRSRGFDLFEAMDGLYVKYGYWASTLLNYSYEGPEGAESMVAIMEGLRSHAPATVCGIDVEKIVDYAGSITMPSTKPSSMSQALPSANVVEFVLRGGSRVIFRPSGTEPKMKSYIFAKGGTREEAKELLDALRIESEAILKGESR